MMAAVGTRFAEYVTMGGGSQSDLWCQIMADITGVSVVRSTSTEATCLGAGILAATAAGWYADVGTAAASMTGSAERFAPRPAQQEIYDRLYREVYRDLFPALRSSVDRLTLLTAEIVENKNALS